jgi:lipopolysaccharide transport system ATP-binding protein
MQAKDNSNSNEVANNLRYAIDIYGLNKQFKRKTLGKKNGYTTFKSALLGLFTKKSTDNFNLTVAVKDLTLRVPQGSSVGIIGRNGSGKSSLLKLITGIYKPDSGRVSVNGRIAALIELGAGFHPDFTGRENLYLAGAMHGLTRNEVSKLLPDIISFSELTEVIDDPVRTYSSGMFMRLGFSLAIHINPDVLLVDEVLAVGDAGFVAKCKDRISSFRKTGKTLLMVSHDLAAVERWCDEVVWLHKGVVKDRGEPRRVIDAYVKFIENEEEQNLVSSNLKHQEEINQLNSPDTNDLSNDQKVEREAERWGSREIEILEVILENESGTKQFLFHPEDNLKIRIKYRVNSIYKNPVFGIAIHRADGVLVHGSNTDIEKITVPTLENQGEIIYDISRIGLLEGSYLLDVAVHTDDGYPYDYRKAILNFVVRSKLNIVGVFNPEHKWAFK